MGGGWGDRLIKWVGERKGEYEKVYVVYSARKRRWAGVGKGVVDSVLRSIHTCLKANAHSTLRPGACV